MGWELATGKITASLNRSSEEKANRHDELWRDFAKKIKYLSRNPKYKEINLTIDIEDDH